MRLNGVNYKQSLLLVSCILLLTGCIQSERRRVDAERAANARSQLALAYIKISETEAAYRQVVLALQHAPWQRDIQLTAALYYQVMFQYQQAENYYRQALNQEPTDLANLILYTHFLCKTNRFSEAKQYYRQIMANLTELWLRYLNQLNQSCQNLANESKDDWTILSEKIQLKKATFKNSRIGLFDLFIDIIETSMN